jgi:hypothetical protein
LKFKRLVFPSLFLLNAPWIFLAASSIRWSISIRFFSSSYFFKT